MSSWHDKNAKAWQNSFKYFQSEFHGLTNESNIYKIYLRKHICLYIYTVPTKSLCPTILHIVIIVTLSPDWITDPFI